ncbi:hypothetical protein [Micromonospora vulcania]|uniref:Uncharacterized protein n=1 Tax=Micromonospora vulcania TaxID=1441873 RepID=A0ABW1HBC2_9ACTN
MPDEKPNPAEPDTPPPTTPTARPAAQNSNRVPGRSVYPNRVPAHRWVT